MNSFIDYIETAFSHEKQTDVLYRYKQQLLEQMTDRSNEITHTGLKDEKVLFDLVTSEHPDLQKEYKSFYRADRKKKRQALTNKIMIFGSLAFVLGWSIVYLSVSFALGNWSTSWLLLLGGIFAWVLFLLSVGIYRLSQKGRLSQTIARLLLMGGVMLITTFSFLMARIGFHVMNAWILYPIGVVFLFLADGIYASVTKQKLRIINHLIYIPAIFSMLYVIFGALSIIPWHPGWLMMPLAVLIDIILITAKIVENAKYKYKQEEVDVWNEN